MTKKRVTHGVSKSLDPDAETLRLEEKRIRDTVAFYRSNGEGKKADLLESQIPARLEKLRKTHRRTAKDFENLSGAAGVSRFKKAAKDKRR